MATFIETITTPGQGIVGSQNGRIVLDEAQGKISITDQVGQERTRLDLSGFLTTDGTTSTKINPPGIVQNDGTNDRIVLGDDSKL